MTTFTERLKDARKRAGVTQVALSKKMDIARQTYLDLESGKTPPRLDRIEQIAHILEVNKVWLAFGSNEKPSLPPRLVTVDGVHYLPQSEAA